MSGSGSASGAARFLGNAGWVRLSAAAEQGADQAGGPAAGDDDPVTGEDLVVGQGVAAFLDRAPVDPEDHVRPPGRMRPDVVRLLGEAVNAQTRRQDCVEYGLVARDREPPLGVDAPEHVIRLARAA